jgi:lysophospholipid acyltransferase (LPLAT)-like uncharacterized protein
MREFPILILIRVQFHNTATAMKLRHPVMLRGLGLVGALVLRQWMNTLALRVDMRASGEHPTDPRRQRFLYAFWHEALLVATCFHSRVHIMISQHADGELITQVCRHLRIGVARGSTTRGGSAAVWEMLAAARHSHLAMTPDGPRGPRRRVQPGTLYLASQSGLPIVPFGVGFARAWRARSWDRMAVPFPYSRVTCVAAEPMHVPAGLDARALAHFRALLQERLLQATDEAERWATGTPRRGWACRTPVPAAA